jgi:hypothetical protein
MVKKECGLASLKSNPKPAIGISDTETVKLDFDDTPLDVVKYWALRAMKWFKLEGFIILLSSEKAFTVKYRRKVIFTLRIKSFHVVFNRRVSWRKNVHVMSWVAMLSQIPKLKKYVLMQCIKEGSTLRVSPKGDKPSPRIVYRHGKQDKQIRKVLENRRFIKVIIRKMQTS